MRESGYAVRHALAWRPLDLERDGYKHLVAGRLFADNATVAMIVFHGRASASARI